MKIGADDFSPFDIAESGQCFRMRRVKDDTYRLAAFGRPLAVRALPGEGCVELSCTEDEYGTLWRHYFDLDSDYAEYRKLCLPEDDFLKTCMEFGKGIRILFQDPWEMLISFIISQRKSVPAIRTSVERLCTLLGKRICGDIPELGPGILTHSFPSPSELLSATYEELSSCGIGYRTPYLRAAAEAAVSGELDLEGLRALGTEALIERLMELNGVGIKVASCEALFGYHRLDTVPVDVWMKRVIETRYGGKLPEEYRPYAGVLQQYMFNYARMTRLKAGN